MKTLKKKSNRLLNNSIIQLFNISIIFCLVSIASANTLPIHIDPFLNNEYESNVWGCRLSRCLNPYHENIKDWENKTPDKHVVACYTNWLATAGEDLITRWRAGEPITNETDKLYLPLAKTEFWNDMLMKKCPENNSNWWDGSKAYFRGRKFPALTKFPVEDRPDNAAYQAILEAGLVALHKIYNQQTLTETDKTNFYEWALGRYCGYYGGSVVPRSIPGDNYTDFTFNLQDDPEVQQGDIFPNVPMYKPYHYWEQPDFSETNYFDVSMHLRAGKTNDLLNDYITYAKNYEPHGVYPRVRPKCPPSDSPDTNEYRTFYNFLAEEGKPALFGTWTINNDEGDVRMVPHLHFLHRIWRNKLGFAIAEGSVNELEEKNDLRFDPSENEQYRTHLLRCFNAPFMPVSYVSPIFQFFNSPCKGNAYRLSLINTNAEFLATYPMIRMNGDFGGHLATFLRWDKRLIEEFKAGFDADPSGNNMLSTPAYNSIIEDRTVQCKANGYDIKAYNRYANHIDIIGEIIAVDTDNYTVTMLREEFHEEEYPVLALKERFPASFNEYKTRDHRHRVTGIHWDDLAARKKAGNSKSARTLTFNVNVGVGIFLNGEEKEDESCLKIGDVASIVYLEDKGGYPHFIRAIRFNFPPTFGEVANTGAGTAELRGIDDDNLIVDQEITVTAKSSSSKMPDPVVAYKKGVCTFTYTPPPVGETVNVRVTIQDDGSTEFGGNDATKLTLKFTADGATLAQ